MASLTCLAPRSRDLITAGLGSIIDPAGAAATFWELPFWPDFMEPCSRAVRVMWATCHVGNGGHVVSVLDKDPISVISQNISNKKHHSWQYLLSDYSLENSRLYFNNKLFLPNQEPLCHRILLESHDKPMTRHPGVARKYEILQRQYYKPTMIDSVCQYIRNCHVCSRAQPARNKQGELVLPSVPHQPWKNLALDFITELSVSSDDCYPHSRHIWVVTDKLTKKKHFVSCQDMTASHLARMFI